MMKKRKCLNCKTVTKWSCEQEKVPYLEAGLPNVWVNAETRVCSICGEEVTAYGKIGPLHDKLAVRFVYGDVEFPFRVRLFGSEVAFLRRYADVTTEELAHALSWPTGKLTKFENKNAMLSAYATLLVRAHVARRAGMLQP